MPPLTPPAREDALAFLAATRLFGGLDSEARAALAAHLRWEYLAAGDVLCREGDVDGALYLVASGRLLAVRPTATGEAVLREAVRGDSIGELALLTGAGRSATVRAARDSVVARLERDDFERALLAHPQAALALARLVAS